MKQFTTMVTLVLSLPDGVTDQQAFQQINTNVNPFGIDFIFPGRPGIDNPVIIARILKMDDTQKA